MKIHFVLPSLKLHPVGGYKMVYMYANYLCEKGYDVGIVYLNDRSLRRFHLPETLRRLIMNLYSKCKIKWYNINDKVSILSATENKFKTSDVDVVVATEIHTVEPVLKLYKESEVFHYIQDHENWSVPDEYVYKIYKLNCKKIVVAKWLKNLVEKYAVDDVELVPNNINLDIYTVTKPINNRPAHSVALLYHTKEIKGLRYSLQAIKDLKSEYPDMVVNMFGAVDRPGDIPEWINYKKNATQRQTVEIYNSVSVFLCASICEGFGLTGLEAMACGDVLVSTDYDGVREYAVDKENALLSPVKDVEALKANIRIVFDNYPERMRLAYAAVDSAKQKDIKISFEKFEKTITHSK